MNVFPPPLPDGTREMIADITLFMRLSCMGLDLRLTLSNLLNIMSNMKNILSKLLNIISNLHYNGSMEYNKGIH